MASFRARTRFSAVTPAGLLRTATGQLTSANSSGGSKSTKRAGDELGLARATAIRSAARPDAVQGRRRTARRRGLAVRAQMGRLPHAGLPGRLRSDAPEPGQPADEPLLPGVGRSAPRGTARTMRP